MSMRLLWCVAHSCVTSYQPEDGFGPKLEEQLKLNPFHCVIQSQALKEKNGGVNMSAT